MTIGASFNQFYNGFGIPGYPITAVPDDAKAPYLTYDMPQSNWNSGEVSQTVKIWYKTESEAAPNAKAKEIRNAIGLGGKIIQCEDGTVWLKLGSPWCINADSQDNTLKLRQLNVTLEYFTL